MASLREIFGAFKTTVTLREIIHMARETDRTLDDIGLEYSHAGLDRSNILACAAYRANRRLAALADMINHFGLRVPLDAPLTVVPNGKAERDDRREQVEREREAGRLRDMLEANEARRAHGLPPIQHAPEKAFQN